MKPRHGVTDVQWAKISALLPQKCRGRPSKLGDRAFVNAVIWRAKTGVSWRELDPRFGNWKTVYNRFRDWSNRGIWRSLVRTMSLTKQEAHSILDSTVVRAHQESGGGRGGVKKNGIGRSKGGFSTKIHAMVDFRRNLGGLALTPGNCHDSKMALPFIAVAKGKSFIADRAYQSNTIIAAIKAAGMKPVIPSKCNSLRPKKLNKYLYEKRITVEHFFHKLKAFRAVATRYCKTAKSFLSTISAACLARI